MVLWGGEGLGRKAGAEQVQKGTYRGGERLKMDLERNGTIGKTRSLNTQSHTNATFTFSW